MDILKKKKTMLTLIAIISLVVVTLVFIIAQPFKYFGWQTIALSNVGSIKVRAIGLLCKMNSKEFYILMIQILKIKHILSAFMVQMMSYFLKKS